MSGLEKGRWKMGYCSNIEKGVSQLEAQNVSCVLSKHRAMNRALNYRKMLVQC